MPSMCSAQNAHETQILLITSRNESGHNQRLRFAWMTSKYLLSRKSWTYKSMFCFAFKVCFEDPIYLCAKYRMFYTRINICMHWNRNNLMPISIDYNKRDWISITEQFNCLVPKLVLCLLAHTTHAALSMFVSTPEMSWHLLKRGFRTKN